MKLFISLAIFLLLTACAKEEKKMLKSESLFCKDINAFGGGKDDVSLFMSYTTRYGIERGTILYNEAKGCKKLPKYTSFIILEDNRGFKYAIIKTETKDIGYIEQESLKI